VPARDEAVPEIIDDVSQGSATEAAFAAMPGVRSIAGSVARGTCVLIGVLVLIGLFITATPLASGIRRWDKSVNRSLADGRSDFFVRLAEWFSSLADTRPIVGFLLLLTITLAVCRQWRAMLLIPLAMLIEISTFLSVNYLVGRPRPDVTKIGPIPRTYSFPSGHVAATAVCWFGAALLLYLFGRWTLSRVISAIGAVMVVLTAWSRVYLGMHHPLDVVAGLAMGIAALAIAVWSLRVRLDPRPSATWR
jgi:undecaprenyl-diphosphatase